jgi:hypothetical protein
MIWYYDLMFSSWDYDYQQYRDGLVDETAIPIKQWIGSFQDDDVGLERFWQNNKRNYSPDFVEFMEESVVSR